MAIFGLYHSRVITYDRRAFIRLATGCRHSSVDSSAPTILLPRVRVQSTLSTLFSHRYSQIYAIFLCVKNENKQKEAVFGPFLKNGQRWLILAYLDCITNLPLQIGLVLINIRSPSVFMHYLPNNYHSKQPKNGSQCDQIRLFKALVA